MAKTKKINNKAGVKTRTKSRAPSTQKFLEMAEIRDNCVIMKDGTLRAVLLVSSINFALKSEDEQNAIIAAYITFLNSLQFNLQIVIQSRRLNIEAYLDRLAKIEKEQTNELLRIQIAEYRHYVLELVEIGEIMTKRFYVVIPYNPLSDTQKSLFKKFIELFASVSAIKLTKKRFEQRKKELFQRTDHIISLLNSMGLKAIILDTQSLIELYYNTYNPKTAEREKLADINKLRIEG